MEFFSPGEGEDSYLLIPFRSDLLGNFFNLSQAVIDPRFAQFGAEPVLPVPSGWHRDT